jgi:NAD(P)-dependent dehydrogenase (short-subunit alcohol dehydrogenase family)
MARERYELSGKAVLVTGAARGIGAETARHLARKGARVSLVGLEPELLERVAADCGPGAVWFEADVLDVDALQRAVDGTVQALGGIDVAMANAGIATGGTIRHADLAGLERILEVNLIGAIRTLKLCLPHVVERRGYLLQVASVAAIGAPPGLAAYAASKAGVEAFANSLRMELSFLGVDVGVAYYSWIDTEMVRGGDDRRDFGHLRGSLTGPFSKTYPVSKAAEATVRGIERRARHVAFPGWIRAMILGRGLSPFFFERQVGDDVSELDRLSGEEAERLGADASAPAGAGGEAAVRSAPLH